MILRRGDDSHPLQRLRVWLTVAFLVPVVVAITLAFLIAGNTPGRIIGAVLAVILIAVATRQVVVRRARQSSRP